MRNAALRKLTTLVSDAIRDGLIRSTHECMELDCGRCHGYIAPLAYGDGKPCACPCHDAGGNPRDYALAERDAYLAYYVDHQQRYGI